MHKLVLLSICILECLSENNPIVVKNAKIGQPVRDQISSTTELTFWFTGNATEKIAELTINFDFSVGSNAHVDTPVRFDVQWKDVIEQPTRTWLLPLELVDQNNIKTIYKDYNSTLCSDINGKYTDIREEAVVKVTVSTTSVLNVDFILHVYFGESNIISEFQNPRKVDMTLFSPVYFKLKFNESVTNGLEFGVIEIWSDDSICMTVALRSPQCPLIQGETDAELMRHLTMSKTASVPIDTKDLTEGRFLIFVMNENDQNCFSTKDEVLPTSGANFKVLGGQLRQKQFYFALQTKITYEDYYYAMGFTMEIVLGVSVFLFVIATLFIRYLNQSREGNSVNSFESQNSELPSTSSVNTVNHSIKNGLGNATNSLNGHDETKSPNDEDEVNEENETLSAHSSKKVTPESDENDTRHKNKQSVDPNIMNGIGIENEPPVTDSPNGHGDDTNSLNTPFTENESRSNENETPESAENNQSDENVLLIAGDNENHERRFWIFLKRKTRLERTSSKTENTTQYFGTLVLLAIFNIIPAFQLMWIYRRFYKISGNEDICYFNFRCLHAYYWRSYLGSPAFNHLFSNIGYIFTGFVFILVVLFDTSDKDKGIFMTMGFSVVVQGVMSALYHDCPNQISFQFDTSFMYVTAALLTSHFYQKHHPGANASSTTSYVIVSIALALGVTAVISKVHQFLFGIMLVHIVICFLVSCHLDSIHGGYTWELAWPRNLTRNDITSSFTKPFTIKSFSWVKLSTVSLCLLNCIVAWILVKVWISEKSQDYASYVLMLFITNAVLFFVVYVIMKVKEKGRPPVVILVSCIVLAVTAMTVGIVAAIFYNNHTASWSDSPSGSRIENQDCISLGFYDSHDIWHFLSALGEFMGLMLLYIMDHWT